MDIERAQRRPMHIERASRRLRETDDSPWLPLSRATGQSVAFLMELRRSQGFQVAGAKPGAARPDAVAKPGAADTAREALKRSSQRLAQLRASLQRARATYEDEGQPDSVRLAAVGFAHELGFEVQRLIDADAEYLLSKGTK